MVRVIYISIGEFYNWCEGHRACVPAAGPSGAERGKDQRGGDVNMFAQDMKYAMEGKHWLNTKPLTDIRNWTNNRH